MSYMLYSGEMLEGLRRISHPKAEEYVDAFHKLTDSLATTLAEACNVKRNPDISRLYDSQIACSFYPKWKGQPLPEGLEGDTESEWGEDE